MAHCFRQPTNLTPVPPRRSTWWFAPGSVYKKAAKARGPYKKRPALICTGS
jgi:hypothetical protein